VEKHSSEGTKMRTLNSQAERKVASHIAGALIALLFGVPAALHLVASLLVA
jgi:hypothetical protein